MIDIFIKWALPILFGAVLTYIVTLRLKIKAVGEGVKCLLRMEIIRQYEVWKDKEYCPLHIKDATEMAYNAYHELGGNDMATQMYKTIKEKPTEV